jgi:hypothetical protein
MSQNMTIQEWVNRKKQRNTKKRNRSSLQKRVVFVDNTPEFWKNDMSRFSHSMDYIRIKSDTKNNKSPQESNYVKKMASEGNRYAASVISTTGSNALSYPPNNGIDEAVSKKLRLWAKKVKGEKYALFDWDRTISCVEGIVPSAVSYDDKEFFDDTFEYLIRKDRIPMLKTLFRELKDAGVHIHILTHNSAASVDSPYREVFLEMMSRLFNDDEEQTEEYDYTEDGAQIHVFKESVSKISLIGREELDSMLHSTIDYTLPGKPLHKSNMVCHIVPGMQHCPSPHNKMTRRQRPVVLIPFPA